MRMGHLILTLIAAAVLIGGFIPAAYAGDMPVDDVQFIRQLLLQPDADFSPFIGEELCDAFIWLIQNDRTPQRERVIGRVMARFWVTGDDRAVPYLMTYIDSYTLDCLYNLGYFSTPESCKTLLPYLSDEDEFNRRFAAQSIGKLDYTKSEDMWKLRDLVLNRLGERLNVEKEEWILPYLNDAFAAVDAQVFPEDDSQLGK